MHQQNTSLNCSASRDLLTPEDRQFISSVIVASVSSELEASIDKMFGKKADRIISLFDFHKQLVNHDWYYLYSDCYETRKQARQDESRLEAIASCHYKFATLLAQFKRWVGVNFNSPCPHPEKPEEDVVIKHNYVKPVEPEMIQVYCRRGCNVSSIPKEQETDECASCGSIMREDYEESFCEAHEPDDFADEF